MKCSQANDTSSDKDFHGSDVDSGAQSITIGSSSEYVVSEEELDTESEEETNRKRISHCRGRKRVGHIAGGRKFQTSQVMMETSVEHDELLQARLKKGKGAAVVHRQTRASSKFCISENANKVKKGGGSHSAGHHRKRASPKTCGTVQGKTKGKCISPKVVDAVFGNLENCVPQVEELRQKRAEDARKCGRIIKTLGNSSEKMSGPHATATACHDNDNLRERNQAPVNESPTSHDNVTPKDIVTGLQRTTTESRNEDMLRVEDVEDHPTFQQFHKAGDLNSPPPMPTAKDSYKQGTVCRKMMDISVREGEDVHAFNHRVQLSEHFTKKRRSLTPMEDYDTNQQKRNRVRQEVYSTQAHERRRERPCNYVPTSPQGNPSYNYEPTSPSPLRDGSLLRSGQRSCSTSPTYEQRTMQRRSEPHIDMQLLKGSASEKKQHGCWDVPWEQNQEHLRHGSRGSFPNDRQYQYKRTNSPSKSRDRRMQSPSFCRSRSPSLPLLRLPPPVGATIDNRFRFHKTEDALITSQSLDRRTRRYKQSARESQKLQRQREGKKPFYLTVDNDGRPYGLGRPAWIAEINKLAKGLDPSCTDIRKQTHMDMCIFKDRLNEHFDYSADLNEDYLRGLMGKAVTRKRTDLIQLIQKEGKQPLHIDIAIWERLKMLANSEQRERRTEHGRYANACRRTFGRTGSLGEDGVREQLHELHGRSPDPDEVAKEMQRDKGFGKLKAKKGSLSEQRKKVCTDDMLHEEYMTLQSSSMRLGGCSEDEIEYGKQESRRKVCNQKQKDALVVEHVEETEYIPRQHDVRGRTACRDGEESMSKDDYIAQLEAELHSLRGVTGKGSSSRRLRRSNSGSSPREDQ